MKNIIKISLLLLLYTQSINYGVYTVYNPDNLDNPTIVTIEDSDDTPLVNGTYTKNYEETTWKFTDTSDPDYPTLNVTVLDTSYTEFTNIAAYGPEDDTQYPTSNYNKLNYNNEEHVIYIDKNGTGNITIKIDLSLEFVSSQNAKETFYTNTTQTYESITNDDLFTQAQLDIFNCNAPTINNASWEFDLGVENGKLYWIITKTGTPQFKFCPL